MYILLEIVPGSFFLITVYRWVTVNYMFSYLFSTTAAFWKVYFGNQATMQPLTDQKWFNS